MLSNVTAETGSVNLQFRICCPYLEEGTSVRSLFTEQPLLFLHAYVLLFMCPLVSLQSILMSDLTYCYPVDLCAWQLLKSWAMEDSGWP